MDYLEGPTTQRPLNLDDDSGSESGIQDESTNLAPGACVATGAPCSVEPEEDSRDTSADTLSSTSSDNGSSPPDDPADPVLMVDPPRPVEPERRSRPSSAYRSPSLDGIALQDFEDLGAYPVEPEVFVSRTFLLNSTRELKRSLRALDQRMTRLEEILHVLHEDVADSLLSSRSLLSRTREKILEQRNAVQQERQLYSTGLQEMEVKLTKVELAVSTLKVQHSSDAAHIQHLITNFEEWHPVFEDIGARLGRMEEIDGVARSLARRTEEKFHELAAGQLDLSTRLDDALESIWPRRPLAFELRQVSSETETTPQKVAQMEEAPGQTTVEGTCDPTNKLIGPSCLAKVAAMADGLLRQVVMRVLNCEILAPFVGFIPLIFLDILVRFIWPSMTIATDKPDHPFWRSVRS